MQELTLKETRHLFKKIIKGLFREEITSGLDLNPDDEEQLFLWLQENGFAPLFLFHFPTAQLTDRFSANFINQLRTQARQEAVIEIESNIALKELLTIFEDRAIDLILMKGTALSHRHYPKPGLRPRSDTDLLVRANNFLEVCEILKEAGYSLPYENSGDLVSTARVYSRPLRFGLDHVLDLHSSITSTHGPYKEMMDFSSIKSASVNMPALAPNAFCMNDGHALLHACFHAAQHYSHLGERLIWIYDIHMLVQHISTHDLVNATEFAKSAAMLNLFAHGLDRSHYWFNSEIPKVLHDALITYPGDNSLEMVEEDMERGIAIRAYANLRELKGSKNKLRYVWQRLFPPPRYLLQTSQHQNPLWIPLLYCQRILRASRLALSKLTDAKSK